MKTQIGEKVIFKGVIFWTVLLIILMYLAGCSTVNVHTDKPVNVYENNEKFPLTTDIEIVSDNLPEDDTEAYFDAEAPGEIEETVVYQPSEEEETAPIAAESIPEIEITAASGRESIAKSDDNEEARANALAKAKEEAILQAVSKYVNPEILHDEKERLLNVFSPRQDDIIDRYTVTSEKKGEDSIYRIKISAEIRDDIIKSLLMKNLYDNRVIVITSEKNLGNPMKRHILEHELIDRIKEKGYSIVDYRTLNTEKVRRLVSLIRQGDSESVKRMGIYYLTDLMVVGYIESEFSEVTREIYSAHATGQVKVHRISDRKELASMTIYSIKGFGSNEEKAGLDSLKKISPKIAGDAAGSLPFKYVNKVKIIIQQIGDYHQFKKARKLISDIPYVNKVKEGVKDFDIEETTLYIETTKGVNYIAEKISELKKFVIKEIRDDEISIESRKL